MSPDRKRRSSRAADAVDPPVGAASRFLVELVAWVSGPIAVGRDHRVLAVALFAVLVGLPAIFNVPGDKHQPAPVAVSGQVRIGVEVLLCTAAVIGSAFAFPLWATVVVIVLVVVMVATQIPRWRWLCR
jgi:hypothetical protein